MCSGFPAGSMRGPLLILLFVNDLQALTLLFADDVKLVAPRTQNMNLHSFLMAAWDWSLKWNLPINPAKCNYLTIGQEAPRDGCPIGLVLPSLYPNYSRI